MSKPINVTEADFEELVENSSIPVMVDFWADWCGPCKMIAPTLDQLAEEYDGKVLFAKVDVDSNPNLSVKFFVRSIPMNVIFKDGKPVDQIVGAIDVFAGDADIGLLKSKLNRLFKQITLSKRDEIEEAYSNLEKFGVKVNREGAGTLGTKMVVGEDGVYRFQAQETT